MNANMNRNLEILGNQIANAMMQGAADEMKARGLTSRDLDLKGGTSLLDQVIIEIRALVKPTMDTLLDDGKALVNGGMGGWLNALIATECKQAGAKAVCKVLGPRA